MKAHRYCRDWGGIRGKTGVRGTWAWVRDRARVWVVVTVTGQGLGAVFRSRAQSGARVGARLEGTGAGSGIGEDQRHIRVSRRIMDKGMFMVGVKATLEVTTNIPNLIISNLHNYLFSSLKNALLNQRETPTKCLSKLIVISVSGGLALIGAAYVMDRTLKIPFWISHLTLHAGTTIFMAVLATFALYNIRKYRNSVTSSLVADDFQRLVAFVALFYCASEFSAVLLNAALKPSVETPENAMNPGNVNVNAARVKLLEVWSFWYFFENLFNSSFNFFVYFMASSRFRSALREMCAYAAQRFRS